MGPSAIRSRERPPRQTAGQIELAKIFQNPAGLNAMGTNLYSLPTDASGPADSRKARGPEGLTELLPEGYTQEQSANVSVVIQ